MFGFQVTSCFRGCHLSQIILLPVCSKDLFCYTMDVRVYHGSWGCRLKLSPKPKWQLHRPSSYVAPGQTKIRRSCKKFARRPAQWWGRTIFRVKGLVSKLLVSKNGHSSLSFRCLMWLSWKRVETCESQFCAWRNSMLKERFFFEPWDQTSHRRVSQ